MPRDAPIGFAEELAKQPAVAFVIPAFVSAKD
jgi:hypothetical protein